MLLKSSPSLQLKSQLHHFIRSVFSGHWRQENFYPCRDNATCCACGVILHCGCILSAPQQVSHGLCLQQELVNLSADHHTPPALAELLGAVPTPCWMQFLLDALVSSYRPPLNTHWGFLQLLTLKYQEKVEKKGWQRVLQLGAGPSVPAANSAGEEPWTS